MTSQQDAPPTKRPSLGRHSSSSSTPGASPATGQSPSHRPAAYRPARHVKGHGHGYSRVGPRNTSFGKNLNKLSKAAAAQGGEATEKGKNHRRSLSGSLTPGTSPRPGQMRRNASTFAVTSRNTSNTNLRKNHSSGHLPRQGSSKAMGKSPSSSAMRRTSSGPGKAQLRSPPPKEQPTVHFDVGDDDDEGGEDNGDNEWTEESGSQSPVTTRGSTRNNSVILDKEKLKALNGAESQNGERTSARLSRSPPPPSPPSERAQPPSDRISNHDRIANGDKSSQQASRTPDADAITSRLLQRTSSYAVRPQMTSVSATVTSDAQHQHSLSQSQNSALGDSIPGRDLVSRFITGEDSSTGTPRDSSFLPHHSPPHPQPQEFDAKKRNKSAPNFAKRPSSTNTSPQHSRTHSQRSGTATPTDLPSSRTQQKLWLERASTVSEPQKLVPAILPRSGGPQQLLGLSVNYALGDGRIDPRIQRQFDEAQNEYRVVRQYRNPVVDAIKRLNEVSGSPRRKNASKPALRNGYPHAGLDGQAQEAARERERKKAAAARQEASSAADTRRSRVSFELPTPTKSTHGGDSRRQSFGTEAGVDAESNDIEELCRRLWEHPDVEGGD